MPQVVQLASKLRLGGVWYYAGDPVELDDRDAAIMASRGFTKPAKPGTVPKNVPPSKQKKEPETIPPSEVGDRQGVVTKDDDNEIPRVTKEQSRGHSGKRR